MGTPVNVCNGNKHQSTSLPNILLCWPGYGVYERGKRFPRLGGLEAENPSEPGCVTLAGRKVDYSFHSDLHAVWRKLYHVHCDFDE